MRVVLIRHAEVDHCWSRCCTSEEFDAECRMYDVAPIKEKEYEIQRIEHRRIYISELSRTLATAERLFPKEELTVTGLINEVPLRSSFDMGRKLPLWIWNVSGRLQWLFNSPRQAEGICKTQQRARLFTEMIVEEDVDCVAVTHGFYMNTLLSELRKKGFKTDKTHAKFKNGEYVIASI